jgi:hypothetical protein
VIQHTAKATRLRHGQHLARRGCAMRAYLKAAAIIASLLGTYLALLPLTV